MSVFYARATAHKPVPGAIKKESTIGCAPSTSGIVRRPACSTRPPPPCRDIDTEAGTWLELSAPVAPRLQARSSAAAAPRIFWRKIDRLMDYPTYLSHLLFTGLRKSRRHFGYRKGQETEKDRGLRKSRRRFGCRRFGCRKAKRQRRRRECAKFSTFPAQQPRNQRQASWRRPPHTPL